MLKNAKIPHFFLGGGRLNCLTLRKIILLKTVKGFCCLMQEIKNGIDRTHHKFIPDFVRDYPKVELEIAEMVTADIVDALRRDRIDAALVAGGTCGEGIQEHELFDDRFHLYVSRENPLFERTNVRIEDIDLKELVLLSPGHCMRDQIIELCQAKREVPSHYTFESGSLDTLMRIVDYTHCVTIIPEMAVEYIPAEHRCQVKTLAKGATSRKIAVAVRRTYVKSSIIKALIDTILSKVSRQ